MNLNGILLKLFDIIKTNPALAKIAGSDKLIGDIDSLIYEIKDYGCVDRAEYSDLLIKFGRYDKALESLHSIIDSDPANFRAHYLLSKAYFLTGSLREAQYPIIKCLELRPDYDEGRILLGRIFLKARQYDKAQKIFERYQNVERHSIKAMLYIAKACYYSGGFETASDYLQGLLKQNSTSVFIFAIYVYQLSNVEEYDRAFSILYDAPARCFDYKKFAYVIDFMNAFLFSFAAKGPHLNDYLNEAAAVFKAYEDDSRFLNDEIFDLYKNFALTSYYMKKGEYMKTDECARAVIDYNKNCDVFDYAVFDFEEFSNIYSLSHAKRKKSDASRMNDLGRLHVNSGNVESAMRCFVKAAEYAPDDVATLSMLAECYVLTNKPDEAVFVFEKIKKIDPKNIEAYKRVSEIYSKIGHYEKFISECRQILAMDPSDLFSRYYIGEYLFNNGNSKEAEEFLKFIVSRIEAVLKTKRLDEMGGEARGIYEKTCFILAQIAYKDGAKENTILYLNSVININPENEKAYELLNKLKQNRQEREIMLLLREAEEKESENDLTHAMHLYENVIEINPEFIEAHYRLSKNLIRQENFERALFELQRIFDYNYKSYDRLGEVYLAMALVSYESAKIDNCRESLFSLSHLTNDHSINLMLLYLHKTSFLLFGNSPDFNVLIDELIERRKNSSGDFITDFSMGYIVNSVPKWIFEERAIFEEAKNAAAAAYEADPSDIYAAYSFACALEKSGDIEQAYEFFKHIAALDVNLSAEIAHTKSKYSLINNSEELGASFYRFSLLENLKIFNFIVSATQKVAYSEEARGNFEDAAYYYAKIFAIEPDNAIVAMKKIDLSLAVALSDKNTRISRISAMIKHLKKESGTDQVRAETKFHLGYLYFKLPDDLDVLGSTVENVVMELKYALAIDNKYLPAYSALRLVYQKMGARDKKMYSLALDTIRKAFELIDNKNPYLNLEMGDCYYYFYGQDMKNEALTYYNAAVNYKPDFIEAHFKLASLYRIKKEYEKAILHYGIVYDLEPNGQYGEECKRSISTLKRRHVIE